jgi:hypothetical protein
MSVSHPCQFNTESILLKCMLFRVDRDFNFKEGLGTHKFGRIPCNGEYMTLGGQASGEPEILYRVVDIVHTGFAGSTHAAEIYVVIPDDIAIKNSHLKRISQD